MKISPFATGGLSLVLMLAACSSEEHYSEYERSEAAFRASIGGNPSSAQMWRTAVSIEVNIVTSKETVVQLMSQPFDGVLYDRRKVSSSGKISLTAPQGMGNSVDVVCMQGNKYCVETVTLTGRTSESVSINLDKALADEQTTAQEQTAALAAQPHDAETNTPDNTDRSPLYGSSIAGNSKYIEFDGNRLQNIQYFMDHYFKEKVNARDGLGLDCNYELVSNGPFDITWLAGMCLSNTSHILGYYYHSPDTYADIRYVDLSEVELYDYIDGKAKVQYQVTEEAGAPYGMQAGTWYDTNFDMNDTPTTQSLLQARRFDDIYNTYFVYERFGHDVTKVRGLSFRIDVPVGMHIGFRYRWLNINAPEQYDRLVQLGVTPYTTRDKFKGTSFTAEALNIPYEKGNFRSFVFPMDDITIMGVENDVTGGDLDCNDVVFAFTADLEIYRPTIIVPDIRPKVEHSSTLSWTIGYEDVGRKADYDFNDVVIRLCPDFDNEQINVSLMAAGSDARMYLHYDGPDGDINLGEVHELMGMGSPSPINTTSAVAGTLPVDLGPMAWPDGYTMVNDARRFYVEVQRGTCTDCTDVITLPDSPGQMPEAVLVAGDWQWPMEGTNICTAYNIFPSWARDVTKRTYWEWYANPITGRTVRH